MYLSHSSPTATPYATVTDLGKSIPIAQLRASYAAALEAASGGNGGGDGGGGRGGGGGGGDEDDGAGGEGAAGAAPSAPSTSSLKNQSVLNAARYATTEGYIAPEVMDGEVGFEPADVYAPTRSSSTRPSTRASRRAASRPSTPPSSTAPTAR